MMKSTVLITILSMMLVPACALRENPGGGQPLSLSAAELEFEGLGGEQKTLSVLSSTDWYARSSESWLRLPLASGRGGEEAGYLRVSVEDNIEKEPRTGVITIKNLGQETLTLTVTQSGGTGGVSRRGISTLEDLLGFVKAVNGEGSVAPYLVDGVVKFYADIDAGSVTEWVPAGTAGNPLIYNVDGNNKVITNVNWTVDVSKYPEAGLFGAAEGVTIRRLTLGTKGSSTVTFTGEASGKVQAGAIVGLAKKVVLEKVTNNANLEVTGTQASGANLSLGGLVGYADKDCRIGGGLRSTKGCNSLGNVRASVPGRVGGLAGHNAGAIESCTFNALVSAPADGSYGPGWLCSRSDAAMALVHDNMGYGHVGDTPSMMRNAMMNYKSAFDPENNSVDWTLDDYYDWNEVETRRLADGAAYFHYRCKNVPREIHVLEVDLSSPSVEIEAAYAGDMIPNPNGNANGNNGFKLRERLSDVCARKRKEGENILAGVNASFFDSSAGISRGFHVENGEPLYVNNPSVVQGLPNHAWAFTVFSDGTASCGKKSFSGTIRMGGKDYPFYSVNDTTLRHANAAYQANLFTSNYVRKPYPSKPTIVNELAKNVLYVICEYTSGPMKVNAGAAKAKVVQIADGRGTALSSAPYLTGKNRVGIALSGAMAESWSRVKTGDVVEFTCMMEVDGVAKPVKTMVSAMFQLMTDGKDASNTPNPTSNLYLSYEPKTFPVVSQDLSKVWLVEVDGRNQWVSMGVKGYEIYRIAKKLGGWWTCGLDGGGSSAMWVLDNNGKGAVVNRPCDALGERSCMNYLLVKGK